MSEPRKSVLSNSWKRLRKWLLVILLVIVAFIGSLGLLAYIYEDEVKTFFISKLNERLNTKVEIGEINLSLLDGFPDASIVLSRVKIHHSANFKGEGYFLESEKLSLRFSLFDLFSKKYILKRISCSDGEAQLISDKNGNVNYQIFKPSQDSTAESFSIQLNDIDLKSLHVKVSLVPNNYYSDCLIKNAKLEGAFNEEQFNLSINSELDFAYLKANEITWIKDLPVRIGCDLLVNKESSTYLFREGFLAFSEMEVGIQGNLKLKDKTEVDLKFSGKDLDLSSFLSLLPSEYQEYTKDYSGDGTFYCDASIKGLWDQQTTPHVKADFGLNNGDILYRRNNVRLEQVQLKGIFSNGQKNSLRTSSFQLSELKFTMEGGSASGKIRIDDFTNAYAEGDLIADLNLEHVHRFLPENEIQEMQGKTGLNIHFEGYPSKLFGEQNHPGNYIQASGKLTLQDASFRLKKDSLSYRQINGAFTFNRYDVLIDRLSGFVGGSDFRLNGSLQNLFGYLFTDNQAINIQALVQSNMVHLDELVGSSSTSSETYHLRVSPRLTLKMNLRINGLQFRNFSTQGIVGDISVDSRLIKADKLVLKTMGGQVKLEGSINGNSEDELAVICRSELKNIDIKKLFYQCENFGQTVITDANLGGKITCTLDLAFPMSSSLSIDSKRLKAVSDITIQEGRLVSFEPLNNLSRFISLEELKDVRFSTLNNRIEISNRTIQIPRMEIASSALTIFASGNHTFDNVVDYHIQLTMSDVLSKRAKKAKKENEEFGIVEDDGLGRTQLFLHMSGPIDNPSISYDSKGVKEKFKNDAKEEKQTLKQLLKEEFGLFKRDTTLSKKKEEKKRKVILEFEEEE